MYTTEVNGTAIAFAFSLDKSVKNHADAVAMFDQCSGCWNIVQASRALTRSQRALLGVDTLR